jgi:hypothetical protein
MDKLNLRVMVSADNSSGDRLTRALAAINASTHKDRFRVLAGINFSNVGPDWGARAVAQLEADIKAGAVGVGEVPKSFGLRNRKPDGSRLRIDDPELDPIWAAFARWAFPCSFTPPSRRSSSSRSTCTTSGGWSSPCLPIAATTSLAA